MRQIRGPAGQPVLLVEDETRLRHMLVRAMREMGYQPSGAPTAEHAERLLEQRLYPILIIDLDLPGRAGQDLLKRVRRSHPDTQAIILTGAGDPGAARRRTDVDIVAVLNKPYALGDLEVALGRAFHRLQEVQPSLLAPELGDPDEADEADDEESARDAADAPSSWDDEPAADQRAARHRALELKPSPPATAATLSRNDDVERATILAILERHGGNRAAAADELGISIRKLYYRLAQYHREGVAV